MIEGLKGLVKDDEEFEKQVELGILIGDINDALAKSLGMEKPRGIIVQDLVKDGAAESSDIKVGDVILKVDGKEINQPNQLQSYIATKTAGTSVTLTIFRDGKEIERKVTLKARESDAKTEPVVDNSTKEDDSGNRTSIKTFDELGFTVRNLTKGDKEKYNAENGVIITDVKPFSKAEDQSLLKGLIIAEADKKRIKDVDDLNEVFKEKKGSAVLLKLQDADGVNRFRGIEIPE